MGKKERKKQDKDRRRKESDTMRDARRQRDEDVTEMPEVEDEGEDEEGEDVEGEDELSGEQRADDVAADVAEDEDAAADGETDAADE